MPTERAITRQIREYVSGLPHVFWFKIHGSSFQKPGIPDMLIVVDGRPVFIEIKRPGGRPTALQQLVMQQIRDAGGTAEVVWSLDDAKRVIGIGY